MDGVDKAYSSGTLAYQQAGNYVIRGVSTTLSGAANTAIQSPGSDNGRRRPIHYNEVVYTTHAPSGYYYHTGLPVNGVTTESGIFANDHAARPTAAIPGELTLHQGALAAPTNFDYPARTLT